MKILGRKAKNLKILLRRISFHSKYEILKKTHNYSQNSERYVNSSLEPDFQFRSKITGKIFHVEAKFRTKSYNNTYDILSENQFKSFPGINSVYPIYIALGFGGGPLIRNT